MDLCYIYVLSAVAGMNTGRQLRFVRPHKEQKSLKVEDSKLVALVKQSLTIIKYSPHPPLIAGPNKFQ